MSQENIRNTLKRNSHDFEETFVIGYIPNSQMSTSSAARNENFIETKTLQWKKPLLVLIVKNPAWCLLNTK